MPVVMNMRWEGVTPEQYEQTLELVKWEDDVPTGALYHVAAFDDSALYVTDIWESAEHFQQFVQTRLMPGTTQLGLAGQPSVEIRPAHRVFTPGYTAKT